MSARFREMLAQAPPRKLPPVDKIAEALVKTYRWLTLGAALLITLCEVLLFNSEVVGSPPKQASVGAAVSTGSGTDAQRSLSGIASLYWAAAGAQTTERVR
jgi:hypothetical protein